MSQLIQMTQRIKTIETISKVTHAMQLISMSTHLKLRDKKGKIEQYQQTLKDILIAATDQIGAWHNPILYPSNKIKKNQLVILIGSQKGLCGTFNTNLYHTFEKDLKKNRFINGHLITIGKKITESIQLHAKSGKFPLELTTSFQELNWRTIPTIVNSILQAIINPIEPYTSVLVYSNYSAGFFIQRQQIVTLVPLDFGKTENPHQNNEPYIWSDNPTEVIDQIAYQYLHATLYYLITQSLLAEQAARFISMDNATRNAQHLRETMLLQYNKARQAKITKELTELSSSFQTDLSA